MLVLTRKIDEKIKIGDDITITVIKLRNNQIRLGIDAPREVRVLRAELEEKETGQSAASVAPSTPVESTRSTPRLKSESLRSKSPQSRIRNEVIDGLVSADEMIAKALPDADQGDSLLSGFTENPAPNTEPKPSLQIFSGRVRAKRSEDKGAMRAPLPDYFSAT